MFCKVDLLAQVLGLAHPWVPRVPGLAGLLGREQGVAVSRDIITLMREVVEQHRTTLEPASPRDFIDVVLVEIEGTRDPSSCLYGAMGREQVGLVETVIAMF